MELNIENALEIINSNVLNEFIEDIEQSVFPITVINICKYILEYKEKWQKVKKDIAKTLKEYSLAYEDEEDLNSIGEDFIVMLIQYDIKKRETEEIRQIAGL